MSDQSRAAEAANQQSYRTIGDRTRRRLLEHGPHQAPGRTWWSACCPARRAPTTPRAFNPDAGYGENNAVQVRAATDRPDTAGRLGQCRQYWVLSRSPVLTRD